MSAELAEMVSVMVVINDKVSVFNETPILSNTFLPSDLVLSVYERSQCRLRKSCLCFRI